jgi:two-component system, OmpR family, sensor histidine kinase KdpD
MAGFTVLSTLNTQHLESLNRRAMRRRVAHGNVYASDVVDAALANYFRPGNLTALRELACCG